MAIHKLQIDDFVTVDYKLIAIHSSLDDYRLAYFLNQHLDISLEKSPVNVEIKTPGGESCFTRFIFEDADNDIEWSLIQNRSSVTGSPENPGSLFGGNGLSISTTICLIPELKKVDYILKIENIAPFFALNTLVERLLAIKHITTAYSIDHDKLKSKNNLIF